MDAERLVEIHRKIVALLEAGNYFETACEAAGVTSRCGRKWVRLGVQGDERYAQFAADVDRARASSEARDVLAISKAAARDDWKAAAWRLERRNPKRWGTRIHVTVQEELTAFFEAVEREFDGDEEILARLYRVASGLDSARALGADADDEPTER